MKFELYSIKDVLSGNFSDILIFTNQPMAERYFDNLVSKSEISKDLQFYRLGIFNLSSGEIESKVEFIKAGV